MCVVLNAPRLEDEEHEEEEEEEDEQYAHTYKYKSIYMMYCCIPLSFISVNFDHFQILRAIGKGSFGKV